MSAPHRQAASHRLLVPAPRRDRLERAKFVAGERRHPAERNRAGAGPVCGPAAAGQAGSQHIFRRRLSRAKVTAELAAAELGLPVQVDDGLREVAFGVQEGKPMSEWFQPWVDGMLTPEGAETFRLPHHQLGGRHQPLHHSPARRAGRGARRAVPRLPGRHGPRAQRSHPKRRARSGASPPPKAQGTGASPTPTETGPSPAGAWS